MSGGRFSRDWLRLRAGADLGARYPALARRFAAALPRQQHALRLIDLAAGTGANARALMPRIAGDQDWLLIEGDRDLIATQGDEFTLWARRQGYPISAGGGRILIDAGKARWQATSLPLDLAAEPSRIAEFAPDAITASAFFDLVSADWLTRFVAEFAAMKLPLLAVLTVDGRRAWEPALTEDPIVTAAFSRHQQRDKGFGPALGGKAPQFLADALQRAGFTVERMPSAWRLGLGDTPLLAALIAGEAAAAREAAPDEAEPIAAWEAARRRHLVDGMLQVSIGHEDLLALPPSTPRR